jgi:type IV secretory pathway VirB2 component (pilin)
MQGSSKVIVGILVIFLSIAMLFYIFYRISQFSEQCKVSETTIDICDKLTGPTEIMIIFLLIISGFIIMIVSTGYILLLG